MSESDKLLSYETAKEMFEEFAAWMPEPGQPMPAYDEEAGRYTNKSIERWMDWYADGLVYGVKVPKFDYDPTTEAIKTHANAGLVLEMSSPEVAGRNDYLDKKLFMCPRVNGGVDAGGMPYVTAIEGLDERFSATDANTWALTPVYYVRYEDIPSAEDPEAIAYVDQQFCDSPREGFVACAGAKLPDGTPRPYILRACYMDSCEGETEAYHWTSRSGTVPASGYQMNDDREYGNYSLTQMIQETAAREDGLSYFTAGDLAYQVEFMQLMLGVKGIGPYVSGAGYLPSQRCKERGADTKRVHVLNAPGPVGVNVALGTSNISSSSIGGRSIVHRAPVTAIEYVSDEAAAEKGECWLTLGIDEPISVTTSTKVNALWWPNGSLDGIRGTFGMLEPGDEYWIGMQPFRFQNMEWGLGVADALSNMKCVSGRISVIATPPTAPNEGDWAASPALASSKYFADNLERAHGFLYPEGYSASATTGTATSFAITGNGTICMVYANGNYRSSLAYPGQLCGEDFVGVTTRAICSRLSAIGYSAPAE